MARARQRLAQRADHEAAHQPRVAEAHLGLRGMHVDVDQLRVAGEEEHRRRVAVAGEQVGVGRAQRAEQQLVAHRAAVDEEVLRHRRAAREGRQRREAAEAQALALGVDEKGVGDEVGAEQRAQTAAEGVEEIAGLGVEAEKVARGVRVGAVGEAEADARRGHGEAADDVADRLGLGAIGAQELEPRRRGGEQALELDHRAAGEGGGA